MCWWVSNSLSSLLYASAVQNGVIANRQSYGQSQNDFTYLDMFIHVAVARQRPRYKLLMLELNVV